MPRFTIPTSRLPAKATLSAVACLMLLAMAPTAALAENIKSQVPAGQLADYCRTAGVGSEATTTFMLPDMKRLTGTVRCEAQDLVAAADTSRSLGDNDDGEDDNDNDSDNEARANEGNDD